MKQYVKILLIIAAVLLTLGVLCFTVLAARGGFDSLESISNQNYIEKGSDYELSPTGEIFLNLDTTELIVIPTDNELISLSYFESDQIKYAIDHQNTRLSVSFIKPAFSFKWLFSFDIGKHPMTLSVPRDFSGCIEIKSSTGNVSVKNISGLYELSISATTGNVELEGISAESIDIAVKTGIVKAERVTAENEVGIKSTTGDIELDTVSAEDITTESTTGSQKLRALSCEVSSHIATTGTIVFVGLDAQDIRLSASTGSVRGSLVGSRVNYSVTSTTSTGHSNITSDSHYIAWTRKLYVKTSTGDIKIEFVELIY